MDIMFRSGAAGDFGHPFWGYWDGRYHTFGTRIASADTGTPAAEARGRKYVKTG